MGGGGYIQVLLVSKELRGLIFEEGVGVGGLYTQGQGYFGAIRCINSRFMVSIYKDMGLYTRYLVQTFMQNLKS